MSRRLYIETLGCQMNVLDSELIAASLLEAGYELVDSVRRADTVLFNTCSVRQHAEDKVYSALGRLKQVKDRHPEKIIGVLGCMAQKDRDKIFKRAPHVDLVLGPGQLNRLPALLAEIAAGSGPQMEVTVGWDKRSVVPPEAVKNAAENTLVGLRSACPTLHPDPTLPARTPETRPARHQATVRIMLGCDKFCTYCIVPSVRGPERSRPPEQIEAEVRQLVDQGCLEVTLLGQAVNSYKYRDGGRTVRLADLLYRLDPIPGLRRLKFVTNYPRHMTRELVEAVRDLPRVSPYLHVPAQSGSTRVLRRMKRGYTAEQYRQMLEMIRQVVPGAAVTSDFIVGFCGETEEDFQATVQLVREGRFKNSFIFKYSPRPGTKAAELYPDDVPEVVKRRRNNELLSIQNAISEELNRSLVGRSVEILVEGPSKVGRKGTAAGSSPQLVGRTVCDRIVVFDGPQELIGRILPVEVVEVNAHTLFGKCEARSG